MESEALKERKNGRWPEPKIIVKFEPSPHFEDEFLEFVEEVLSWPEEEEEKQ